MKEAGSENTTVNTSGTENKMLATFVGFSFFFFSDSGIGEGRGRGGRGKRAEGEGEIIPVGSKSEDAPG